MSEETVVAPVVEETVVEAPEVAEADPVEVEAIEQGWVPLEEWKSQGRPEHEHRSAKEFVERGELYKSIHSTKRELKQTQAALDALKRHHKYVYEKAHSQALSELKAEKRFAMREGDFDRVDEIEQEMEQRNAQFVQERAALVQQVEVQQVPPEVQEFYDRNPWYLQDKTLRDEADAVGFVYLNNGGSRIGLLQHVEKEMKRKHADKFGGKRAAPNAVTAVNRTGKARTTDIQLDEMETKIMKDLVDAGTMTKAQYIAELKKAKGIK